MSGASVSCETTGQYYDSRCVDCDWTEENVPSGQSKGVAHAMDEGHEVLIYFVTTSIAKGISKEAAHGTHSAAEQRSGGAATNGKA